ncbi:MAG: glycine cleavage T C-terminal barrel domain-containing protein [Thermoanaerobaculia bacterium]
MTRLPDDGPTARPELIVLSPWPCDLLELQGPDRFRLLQGLVTADVKDLAPGSAASGFFTTGQGRILADFRIFERVEGSWLMLPEGTGEAILTHLTKYKVASQVEMRRLEGRVHFEVRGGEDAETQASALVPGVGSDAVRLVDASGADERQWISLAAEEVEAELGEWQRSSGVELRRLSPGEADLARIERGELRFGVDFSAENFPQETGRESAISYTKGCYLGQEVVARIHYRGGVQRQPRGLRFTGALPLAGAELLLDGRAVGRATSVAASPQFGAIGLALVHQRGAAPGTRLEVAGAPDGSVAEVVALPFGAS